jgi:hypothetical protein
VLKAMGAESDQEVVDLIGPDEALAALLMPSLQVSSGACLDYLQSLLVRLAMQ